MHIVMVRFRVKPDKVADFLRESIGDASGSVLTEPGCRRFDVIQANDDPTMVAFTEVYDNVAAFDDHKTRPHFSTWAKNTKDMLDGPAYVAECRPLFPQGRHAQNALGGGHVDPWSSYRPDAADHPHFRNAGLMVLWVPLPVKPERVNDFIQSALGDCVGSTRGARVPSLRHVPGHQEPVRTLLLRGLRQPGSVRLPRQDPAHSEVAGHGQGLVCPGADRRRTRKEHLAGR